VLRIQGIIGKSLCTSISSSTSLKIMIAKYSNVDARTEESRAIQFHASSAFRPIDIHVE
jgi:hypothetical protein